MELGFHLCEFGYVATDRIATKISIVVDCYTCAEEEEGDGEGLSMTRQARFNSQRHRGYSWGGWGGRARRHTDEFLQDPSPGSCKLPFDHSLRFALSRRLTSFPGLRA